MKYNLSLNTKAVYELAPGLDGIDYFILDYIYYLCSSISSAVAKRRIIDEDGVWTWVDHKHLIAEIPWIGIKSGGGITKRVNKIESARFIKTKKAGGFRLYIRLLPKIDSAFTTGKADTPSFSWRKSQLLPQEKLIYIEDNNTKDHTSARGGANALFVAKEFDLGAEIQKLKSSKQRHMLLIGEYIEEKKIKIDNKKEFDRTVQRHLRDAVVLADFSDEKIGRATRVAEETYSQYTLGTLVKIITR